MIAVVAIAVVIVVIPIAPGAPAMAVFVPPTMTVLPAVLAGLAQIAARVVGSLALAPMMPDGFMEAMIRFRNALLAIVIGAQSSRAAAERKCPQARARQRYS